MNMNSRKNSGAKKNDFQDLETIKDFYKKNLDDTAFDLEYESRMISYRFLSEVDKIMETRGIKKKELAIMLGTSASYITQLFNGNKLINLPTLAKLQHALGIKFSISLEDDKKVVEKDETGDEAWVQAISSNPAFDSLQDSEEDIYSTIENQ